jgi:hypothetical protein
MLRFAAALSRAATPAWRQYLPTSAAAVGSLFAPFHSSSVVAARKGARAKKKDVVMSGDAEWKVDTSFMTDEFQAKAYARGGTVKALNQFEPYQPGAFGWRMVWVFHGQEAHRAFYAWAHINFNYTTPGGLRLWWLASVVPRLCCGVCADNWQELLAQAAAAYPERAGPRRNRARERQKNRR